MNSLRSLDRGILISLMLLMGFGLVQVYSSSFIFATEARGNGLHFFSKQLIFTLLTIFVIFAAARIPHNWIERWGYLLWWVALIGLVGTFVPGIAHKAGGASRWVRFPGGFQYEPSELLKVAHCILLATFLSRRSPWMGLFEWPMKIGVVLASFFLLLKQPDFGTFVICLMVSTTVFFVFGLSWKYIFSAGAIGVPLIIYLVVSSPYRLARVKAFLDPWSDPENKGFQVIQSMLSFHSGGITGSGLGQGQGKLFFLPEAHTDFTLAVLGEEMGFVGFVSVMLIYGFIIYRGIRIAYHSNSDFNRALSLSLIVTFAFSVFINVGVVLGMLPTKGLTLPFLSYGGSSLVTTGLMFGLLLNIGAANTLAPARARRPVKVQRYNPNRSRSPRYSR